VETHSDPRLAYCSPNQVAFLHQCIAFAQFKFYLSRMCHCFVCMASWPAFLFFCPPCIHVPNWYSSTAIQGMINQKREMTITEIKHKNLSKILIIINEICFSQNLTKTEATIDLCHHHHNEQFRQNIS